MFPFLPKRQRYIMSGVQFVKENHPTSLYENAKKLKIKKSFQDSLQYTEPDHTHLVEFQDKKSS